MDNQALPKGWRSERLKKYLIEHDEKTTENNQYPVLTSSRRGLMLQTDYYSDHQVTTDDNIGYNVLPRGYITFRSRSDNGIFVFNENTIIDKGIISYYYPVFSFSDSSDHKFMLELLNFTIRKQAYAYVEGTAQQVLTLKKLGTFKYNLPPLVEQCAIAEILMTADKLIATKERLISAKHKQKRWLMQNLLTGKRRMPGFSGEWESVRLGDGRYFNINPVVQSIPNRFYYFDLESVVSGKIVNWNVVERDNAPSRAQRTLRKNDILFQMVRPYLQNNYFVSESFDLPCVASTRFAQIRTNQKSEFVFYALHSDKILVDVKAMCVGSNYPAINTSDLKQLSIRLPDIGEQQVISAVLTTADREIELLTRELEQQRQAKKYLMQQLLTGRIRTKEAKA
jgi:type I restriction enzyme S subunit